MYDTITSISHACSREVVGILTSRCFFDRKKLTLAIGVFQGVKIRKADAFEERYSFRVKQAYVLLTVRNLRTAKGP